MEPVLPLVVGEVGRDVARRPGKAAPHVLAELVAPELAYRVLHLRHEGLVRLLRPRDSDDAELLREEASERERVERREELALREVAGGTEDDERARLGRAAQAQPLQQRIVLAALTVVASRPAEPVSGDVSHR